MAQLFRSPFALLNVGHNCAQSSIMRHLNFVFALIITTPAMAQGWSSYANARYGATADVPPGFSVVGPVAANNDGLIFRSKQGTSTLMIFGTEVPGKDFETKITEMMESDHSNLGWKIGDSSVTPSWAEYSGSKGGQQLRVRIKAACGGKLAVAVKYAFTGVDNATVSRLFASLKAGSATAC